MAIDGLGEHSKRPQSANSVWSHGPLLRRYEERSAALFASLPPKPSTPGEFRITPEQAHHDFVPRLRVGASVQQPAEKQDSIWSVMVARSEFDVPEVIRPPPLVADPALATSLGEGAEDYVYLPELPPPTWQHCLRQPGANSIRWTVTSGHEHFKGSFLGAGAHRKLGWAGRYRLGHFTFDPFCLGLVRRCRRIIKCCTGRRRPRAMATVPRRK